MGKSTLGFSEEPRSSLGTSFPIPSSLSDVLELNFPFFFFGNVNYWLEAATPSYWERSPVVSFGAGAVVSAANCRAVPLGWRDACRGPKEAIPLSDSYGRGWVGLSRSRSFSSTPWLGSHTRFCLVGSICTGCTGGVAVICLTWSRPRLPCSCATPLPHPSLCQLVLINLFYHMIRFCINTL